MWSQIESEMCLQRSKTIAQMCRTKQVYCKRGHLQINITFKEVRGRLSLASKPENVVVSNSNGVKNATNCDTEDVKEEDNNFQDDEKRGKQVGFHQLLNNSLI